MSESGLPVTVRRDPESYDSPAYWNATCHPCDDSEVTTWDNAVPMDAWQSAVMFAPVLAWAVHHAYHCPMVLADRLSEITGHRWCSECRRIDPPCQRCNGSGCGPWTALGAFSPCDECGGDGARHADDFYNPEEAS